MSHAASLGRGLMWVLLVVGLLAAPWALLLLPLGTAELDRAADLGLVSFTVNAGYPESQELPVYLRYVLAAPVILGVLVAWRRRESAPPPVSRQVEPRGLRWVSPSRWGWRPSWPRRSVACWRGSSAVGIHGPYTQRGVSAWEWLQYSFP